MLTALPPADVSRKFAAAAVTLTTAGLNVKSYEKADSPPSPADTGGTALTTTSTWRVPLTAGISPHVSIEPSAVPVFPAVFMSMARRLMGGSCADAPNGLLREP
jgi:hypothetical protein